MTGMDEMEKLRKEIKNFSFEGRIEKVLVELLFDVKLIKDKLKIK